jgi:molybdopterin-containing oxidoreductase family membrane subunit
VTLSAGAAFVASLYYGFGREKYKDTARGSLLLAMLSLIFALPLIGADLGHPLRGIFVMLTPDFSSFLPWASWSYLFFLVISFLLIKKEDGADTAMLGKASCFFAAAFLLFEALHFATIIAHPTWNSALVIGLFYGTAMVLGLTVTALLGSKTSSGLRMLLISHLVVVGLMEIGKVFIESSSGIPALQASASHALSSPIFWIYVVCGLVLPVVIFSAKVERAGTVLGSVSILLGMLAAKYDFVVGAFAAPQFAGLPASFHGPGLSTHYVPSSIELGVAIGFLAAVAAAYLWLKPAPAKA